VREAHGLPTKYQVIIPAIIHRKQKTTPAVVPGVANPGGYLGLRTLVATKTKHGEYRAPANGGRHNQNGAEKTDPSDRTLEKIDQA
jgi:hypothetical protein